MKGSICYNNLYFIFNTPSKNFTYCESVMYQNIQCNPSFCSSTGKEFYKHAFGFNSTYPKFNSAVKIKKNFMFGYSPKSILG
jgi:hypothetical protein